MQPMLATRAATPADLPRGPEWAYEVKWDGVRLLADTTGDRLRLLTRNGRDATVAYPELAGLGRLGGAVLDGEVVAMAGGIPSFEALAERMHVRDAARATALAARGSRDVPRVRRARPVRRRPDPALLRRAPGDAASGSSCPTTSSSRPSTPTGTSCGRSPASTASRACVAKRRTSVYQSGPPLAGLGQGRAPHAPGPPSSAAGAWRRPRATGSARCCSARPTPAAAALPRPRRQRARRRRRPAAWSRCSPRSSGRPARSTSPCPAVDARDAHWCEPTVARRHHLPHPHDRAGACASRSCAGCATTPSVDPWEDL